MYGYNNPQANLDRINSQMAELEKMRQQIQQQSMSQPTNLTQNFQITPTNTYNMRYAKSLDEVTKSLVYVETPFFSDDMSVVWIKDGKNNIKTYELTEIIPKDEKDIQIEMLKSRIKELERGARNGTTNEPTHESVKNEKSSSVSNVSKNKRK